MTTSVTTRSIAPAAARPRAAAPPAGRSWRPRCSPCRRRTRSTRLRTAARPRRPASSRRRRGGAAGGATAGRRRGRAVGDGQVDLERGSSPGSRVDLDVPAATGVAMPCTVASPSPVPRPDLLRREERLEECAAGLGVDARPRVADGEAHVAPGGRPGCCWARRPRPADARAPRSSASPPVGIASRALTARLTMHLLDLPAVGDARAAGPRRRAARRDVLADQPRAASASASCDDRAEVERARPQHLLAAEREQLAGQLRGPLGGAQDLVEVVGARAVADLRAERARRSR